MQKELGEVYSEEIWNGNNFLYELPGKWDYSRLALTADDKICGFWIASVNSNSSVGVYTHRVAVKKEHRRYGIAKQMFLDIFNDVKQNKFKRMTLSVSVLNNHAISFYKSVGFFQLSGDELAEFVKYKGLIVDIMNDYIQEKNGHKKFVYALSV